MKNPLKKINFKSKSEELGELCDSLTELVSSLVEDGLELQEKNKKLDIRCQSLELTVREQYRKIKELEKVAFENEQKAVKLKQELHEANFKAVMYSDLAIKLSKENEKLKQRIPAPYEPEGQEKGVRNDESNGSL